MRRTALFICGIAAAGLATLTACGQSVNGSAFGMNSGGAGSNVGGVTTVAQLGQLVASHTSGTSAHIAMQITGTVSANATGVIKFGNPIAMDETTTLAGMGSIEVRLVDNTVYVQLPDSIRSMAGTTTPWVKIDPNGTGAISQLLNGSLSQSQQNADPSKMLDQIKTAGTITSTKSEQLDGQAVTHYTISVDLQKLIDSGNLSAAQSQQLQQAVQMGLKTETINVWTNSDNLPVKFTTSVSLANPQSSGQTIHEDITANFTQWGQPVTVTAPPADQVSTLDK